jgi:hypothetical protein
VFIGEVVQRLQHQDLEHHDGIEGLAAGVALPLLGASLTTVSISPRKLSNGTMTLSASSGSPLALITSRRLSRS